MSFILRENFPFTATFTTEHCTEHCIVTNDQNTNRFRTYGFLGDRLIHFCAIFINPLVSIVAIPIIFLIAKIQNTTDDSFLDSVKCSMLHILTSPLVLINNIFGVFFPNNANNMWKKLEVKINIDIGITENYFFKLD
jgi:hypothetical protein